MLLLKFKISLFLLLSFPVFAQVNTEINCLNHDFKTKISHKGKLLGMVKNSLSLDKNKCVIRIEHKKIMSDVWSIDVCREPVHMKIINRGIDVLKRAESCSRDEKKKGKFCLQLYKIIDLLQDDGLIFAEGEKESLTTPHGQVYCAYSLIQKYLKDGVVLSRIAEKKNDGDQ